MNLARIRRKSQSRRVFLLRGLTIIATAMFLFSQAAEARKDGEIVIVAFGDSLTAGYEIAPEDSFPAQLEAALRKEGYKVRVMNAGVSGDTTAAGLARLDWSVPKEADAVIVELGANDALRGLPPEKARANLDAILAKLKQRGLPVLLAGMLAPRNMGPEYAQAFDSIYADLAEKHDVYIYPFFLEGIAGDKALNLSDGLHPNAKGAAVIVENILPAVEDLIEQVQ